MTKPNIFNYATSELSQDAIIAWLLEWAKPKHINTNLKLHKLGKSFLQSLLDKDEKNNLILNENYNFEIKTRYKKIDVFVSIFLEDKEIAIIIEDKTYSKNHSNQLIRYKELIKSKGYEHILSISHMQFNTIRKQNLIF